MVSTNAPASNRAPPTEKGKGIATSSGQRKRKAQPKGKGKSKARAPSQENIFTKLMGMKFEQAKFVDERVLDQLGIHDDVMLIFANMGIGKFMSMRETADQKLTCQFLSTLKASFYDKNHKVEFAEFGCGEIAFKVNGKHYTMTFNEICDIFGFAMDPSNDDHRFQYPIGEKIRLWRTIASGDFESGVSKAALIRNPAIRYAYKALMHIFYAKVEVDTMTQEGLEFLGAGLKPILPTLADGGEFHGPERIPCLASLLVRCLVEYKDWAWKTKAKKAYIGIGWIVTAIIKAKAKGVQIDTQELPLLDEAYLFNTRIAKKIDNGFAYTFHPSTTTRAKILLPHPSITRIDNLQNVIFDPPHQLYLGTVYEEFSEPIRGAKRYNFEPYTGPMNMASASTAAHERINILQRKCKWQQRIIEKMAKTIKSMKKTMRDMSCKGGDGGDAPRAMMLSGEESSHRAPRKSKGKRPVRAPSPGSSNDSIDLATDSSESPSPPPSP